MESDIPGTYPTESIGAGGKAEIAAEPHLSDGFGAILQRNGVNSEGDTQGPRASSHREGLPCNAESCLGGCGRGDLKASEAANPQPSDSDPYVDMVSGWDMSEVSHPTESEPALDLQPGGDPNEGPSASLNEGGAGKVAEGLGSANSEPELVAEDTSLEVPVELVPLGDSTAPGLERNPPTGDLLEENAGKEDFSPEKSLVRQDLCFVCLKLMHVLTA